MHFTYISEHRTWSQNAIVCTLYIHSSTVLDPPNAILCTLHTLSRLFESVLILNLVLLLNSSIEVLDSMKCRLSRVSRKIDGLRSLVLRIGRYVTVHRNYCSHLNCTLRPFWLRTNIPAVSSSKSRDVIWTWNLVSVVGVAKAELKVSDQWDSHSFQNRAPKFHAVDTSVLLEIEHRVLQSIFITELVSYLYFVIVVIKFLLRCVRRYCIINTNSCTIIFRIILILLSLICN